MGAPPLRRRNPGHAVVRRRPDARNARSHVRQGDLAVNRILDRLLDARLRPDRSIAARWLASAIGAALITTIGPGVASIVMNEASLMERSERNYSNLSSILAENLRYAVSVEDHVITRQILDTVLAQDPELRWLGVI